jgi:hypothetical protein
VARTAQHLWAAQRCTHLQQPLAKTEPTPHYAFALMRCKTAGLHNQRMLTRRLRVGSLSGGRTCWWHPLLCAPGGLVLLCRTLVTNSVLTEWLQYVVCLMVCGRLYQVGTGGAPRRGLPSCIEHWAALCNASAAVPTAACTPCGGPSPTRAREHVAAASSCFERALSCIAPAVCITWDRLLGACLPATLSLQCSGTEPALLPALPRVRT